jgi:hypothetical protein
LVVICGRQLLADKYFPLVNMDREPTERLAADLIISQRRIGSLPAVRVPFMPPTSLLVTVWTTCPSTGKKAVAVAPCRQRQARPHRELRIQQRRLRD